MGCSIFKHKSGIDDRIASLGSFLNDLMESLSYGCDVLGRDIGSYNFADKLISSLVSFRINRLDISNNSSILSCTTCLFLVKEVKILFLQNSFSVVDTGLACLALNTKFSLYSFDVDLQMQLAHSADNHFLSLLVYTYIESWVFSLKFR